MSDFIELHAIQTVPPSCINRDDTGSPKTSRFGGVVRHRVSSQAWKRAIRKDFMSHLDSDDLGCRTKFVAQNIVNALVGRRPDIDPENAMKHVVSLLAIADIKADDKDTGETAALLFLSRGEILRLAEMAERLVDGEKIAKTKKNTSEVRKLLMGNTGIDIALFGRMIAGMPEVGVDAACQVAHAISVHKAIPEFDYFTGVNDSAPVGVAEVAMIGTIEFISSTLYRYATIDVERLVNNLGSREAASLSIGAFVRSFVLSMPGGKQTTFANRTRPDFFLAEVRSDQPASLVNAFENPIDSRGGTARKAAIELARRAVNEDRIYNTHPKISCYFTTEHADSDSLRSFLCERSEISDLQGIINQVANIEYEMN